jgi:alginate O-acetyltransferase complex protein AlgI
VWGFCIVLFNSYPFLLVFLPSAIVIYAIADRSLRTRCPVLIALSLAFYSYWDIRFLPLMVVSILGNWWLAKAYDATRRGSLITLAIAANLAVLGFFKYTNFLADNLAVLGLPMPRWELALPLGISFFTFHHVMYLVDLRGGRAPLYPLDRYALYICFFPQSISGPLARWSEVMHQFGRRAFRKGWEHRVALGAAFVILGLLQKIFLGDRLADHVDPVFEAAARGTVTTSEAWIGTMGFTFQIFFDFSGYSDIAIGVALIFGIVLPKNFDAPYRSISLQDFWRRWHITLSRFLRDYLYIPLGGSRHGLPRHMAALLTTMVLGGLWHGAGWGFVLWGAAHGSALALGVFWRRWLPPVPWFISWFLTFAFVTLVWILFRAPNLDAAIVMFKALAGVPRFFGQEGWRLIGAAAICAILLPPSYRIAAMLTRDPQPLTAILLGFAGIAVLVQLGRNKVYEFIYFQF